MREGKKVIAGMVHCLPLPGTLLYGGSMEAVLHKALADAAALKAVGVDAVIVENTNDRPLAERLETEQTAALAAVARQVVEETGLVVGIDASFNDGPAGIAVACASGASFIRCPVYVDCVMVTGAGKIGPCAKEVLRMRRLLGAEHIGIWADVQVKHSHLLLPEVSLEESARTAWEYGAEVLIVTGLSTGLETPLEAIRRVKKAVPIPVVAGSGFGLENAAEQLEAADGAIVGTAMKKGGSTMEPIDPELGRALMKAVRQAERRIRTDSV
ncbi:MAG: BtpA/SgcQ family protein [Lachnospiraceae bacterium]|nr:BtpA/SgcQ family protein [Lachnospiraceae bacterium]